MEKYELIYTGTYKVVKIFRVSNRRRVLERGLTKEEAKGCKKTPRQQPKYSCFL